MGCGASVVVDPPRALSQSGAPARVPSSSNCNEHVSQQVEPTSEIRQPVVSTSLETLVNEDGTLAAESPTVQRVTDKQRKDKSSSHDGIPTIHSDAEDDSNSDVHNIQMEHSLHGRTIALTALQTSEGAGNENGVELSHFESGKLSLGHVLTLSESDSLDRLAPPIPSSTPQELKQVANFVGEFKVQMPPAVMRPTMTDATRGGHVPGGPSPSNRYEDLSLSEDDEDDGQKRFDMKHWHRFYKWNKKKHTELLDFLWRRFDPDNYSIFCLTYRAQEMLNGAYQGDNVMHGLCCRIEASGFMGDIFLLMHTLKSLDSDDYKVMGVLIVRGLEPPADLLKLVPDLQGDSMQQGYVASDGEQYQVIKADTKDPLIRQFVGGLMVGVSPMPDYQVMHSRELQVQTGQR
ncbi:hypothetical protein CEUSTIGMA_g5191.t1 [Chlamydomonas eustigma]|uniref:EF-1-gamma C-terminal domain-containing protein n=1 Tax=Chlamydomonas eustigma TaxID=1157962 RepID=A0A250X3U0_9CHLO|nr:hypothetical protein CEUSTIGMA_g5191.t1 [Chlamydomonas eustigma]|eukprot:GAX77748.1 hypothetical protein CEUSTIGMA_g5191.t1 [Chlamydomonas eustigma]